jgi:predicted ester cyclase
MSIEENKALVQRVVGFWNRRELDAFFNVLAPDYIEHLPDGDVSLPQIKQYASAFFTAFPDIVFTIENMVADGDMVAVQINWKGTHRGTFMGFSPTGKKIDITNAIFIRILENKWVEFWNVTDMRLVKQLGA